MNVPHRLIRATRITSLTEAASYLLLLLVAMPLKYCAGFPLAVRIAGSIHGALFIALNVLLLACLLRRTLPLRLVVLVGVAALFPFAPFFLDRRLRACDRTTAGGEI